MNASESENYFKAVCTNCGVNVETPLELYDQTVDCPSCGGQFLALPKIDESELIIRAATPPPIIQSGRMDEVFFDEGGVIVTKTRFVAFSQTFAVSGITSVRGVEHSPDRGGLLLLLTIGILIFWVSACLSMERGIELGTGIFWTFVGILMVALSIFCMSRQKPTFSIIINTAGGEVSAVTSRNERFISRIADAITRAIIARG